MQNDANLLLDHIFKIPGNKIVTFSIGENSFAYDIKSSGKIGYAPHHREMLLQTISSAIAHSGGAVIRQFLPVSVKRKLPDGKIDWIPEKNLYAVSFQNGQWIGLSAKEMQYAHETDAKTGEFIGKEDGVHYCDFLN